MAGGNFYAKMSAYLSLDNKEFLTKLEKTNRQIKKFSQQAGKLGSTLSRNVTLPLAAAGAGAVKFAADLETLETSFISLTGGAKQAAATVKELNEFTATTPFQLEGVAKAARQLLAAGTEKSELNSTLRNLGDIAATTGGRIEDIAAIFAKVNAKGKVELENLNQLAERGIPIFTELSKATGLPASELGAGRVSVEEFNRVIRSLSEEGGFAEGSMLRLSETFNGKVSTAFDNLKLAAASLGEELLPLAKKLVDRFTRFAQTVQNMTPATKSLIVDLATFAAVLGPLLVTLSKMSPIIQGLNIAFTAFSTKGVAGLTASFRALGATVTTALGPIGLLATALAFLVSAAVTSYLSNVREDLRKIEERANSIEENARKGQTKKLSGLKLEGKLIEDNIKKLKEKPKLDYGFGPTFDLQIDSEADAYFQDVAKYLREQEEFLGKQVTLQDVLNELERRRLENFRAQNEENREITKDQYDNEQALIKSREDSRKAAHEAEIKRIRAEGQARRDEYERRLRQARSGTDPENQRLADIGILGDVEADDVYNREREAQAIADERRRSVAIDLALQQKKLKISEDQLATEEGLLKTAKETFRNATTDEQREDSQKEVDRLTANVERLRNDANTQRNALRQTEQDYAQATTDYWLTTDAARQAYVDKLLNDNNRLLGEGSLDASGLIARATETAEALDLIKARRQNFIDEASDLEFTDILTGETRKITQEEFDRILGLFDAMVDELEEAPGQFENALEDLIPADFVRDELTALQRDIEKGLVPEGSIAQERFAILKKGYEEMLAFKEAMINSDSEATRNLAKSLEVPATFTDFLKEIKGFSEEDMDAIIEAYDNFAGKIESTQARINAAIGIGTQFVDMLKQSFFQAQETGERFGKTLVTAMKNALKQVAVTIVSLIVLFTALAIAIALATGGMNLKGAAKAIGGVEGGFFRNMAAFTGGQGFGIDSSVFAKSATAGDSGTNMSLVVRGNDLHSAQDGAARGYQRLYG